MLTRRIAIFAGLGVAFFPLLPALSASDPDLLAGLDTDHDGTVSLDEAKKAAEVMFDKLDRDHDGTLTGRELRGRLNCHLTKADYQAIPHNCGHSLGRASHRDLVPRGHDQRRLALLVHTAEPTCVGKQLTLLPVTDAGGLAYLHRHTAARAGVAITGNYNGFSS